MSYIPPPISLTHLSELKVDDSEYSMVAHTDTTIKTRLYKCSVPWENGPLKDLALSSITVTPYTPEECTMIKESSKGNAYYMDSAATSSCSSNRSNLIELTPIKV